MRIFDSFVFTFTQEINETLLIVELRHLKVHANSCPTLDDLGDTRVTQLTFPDGKVERMTDNWRQSDHSEQIITGMWRGTTTFYLKSSTVDKTSLYNPVLKLTSSYQSKRTQSQKVAFEE